MGSGVFHALQVNGGLMASRIGVKVTVRKIAVKAFDEPRPYQIPAAYMTTDWQAVVHDPQVDIVTELAGGTTLARTVILTALKLGKPVTKRACAAAFPSSKLCAKVSSGTASLTFTASSTARAIIS